MTTIKMLLNKTINIMKIILGFKMFEKRIKQAKENNNKLLLLFFKIIKFTRITVTTLFIFGFTIGIVEYNKLTDEEKIALNEKNKIQTENKAKKQAKLEAESKEKAKIEEEKKLESESKEKLEEQQKAKEEEKAKIEEKKNAKEKETPAIETIERENIIGTSNKDFKDISTSSPSLVRNDVTGNLKLSTIVTHEDILEYAKSYYDSNFSNDKEIHAIVNFELNTTARVSKFPNNIIEVVIHEYEKKEEHDAKKLFGGMVLGQYWIYLDNGDIEKIK